MSSPAATSVNDDKYSNLRKVVMPAGIDDNTLVIKTYCGSEIRRIPILNRELTYNELCFMIHRLFRPVLSSNIDNLVLRYIDDDGDMVSMTDDMDVSHAAQISPKLRIRVFDKENIPPPDDLSGNLTRGLSKLNLGGKVMESLKPQLQSLKKNIEDLLTSISQLENQKDAESKPKETTPAKSDVKVGPNIRTLSTADMADLLDGPNRKQSVNASSDNQNPAMSAPAPNPAPASAPQPQPQQPPPQNAPSAVFQDQRPAISTAPVYHNESTPYPPPAQPQQQNQEQNSYGYHTPYSTAAPAPQQAYAAPPYPYSPTQTPVSYGSTPSNTAQQAPNAPYGMQAPSRPPPYQQGPPPAQSSQRPGGGYSGAGALQLPAAYSTPLNPPPPPQGGGNPYYRYQS